MTITQIYRVLRVLPVFAILSMTTVAGFAQRGGLRVEPLGDGPWEFATAEQGMRIKVSIVTRGLFHPWDMAFLPNGDILVADSWPGNGGSASRIAFGPDGYLYLLTEEDDAALLRVESAS